MDDAEFRSARDALITDIVQVRRDRACPQSGHESRSQSLQEAGKLPAHLCESAAAMEQAHDWAAIQFQRLDDVFWNSYRAWQDLGEVVANMNKVNRNLESLVEVGRDIERVSDVWLSFHGKVSCQWASCARWPASARVDFWQAGMQPLP